MKSARVGGSIIGCAVRVGACSSDGNTQRSDWWLSENIDGDRLEVVTFVGSRSCTAFDRLDVDERSDEVVIRAYVTVQSGENGCADDYTWASTQVDLEEPLGDRSLSGCVAPVDGHRAPDLPHDTSACEELVRPDFAGTVTGDYPDK